MATSSSGSPDNGRGADLDWHLDAFLLSIALERVTIERFMLARVVAAAVFRDQLQYLLEYLSLDGDLRHSTSP